jgi:hypothetical protein
VRHADLLLAGAAAAVVLAAGALTSRTAGARIGAQLQLAAGTGAGGPVTVGLAAPAGPPAWQPHTPAGAHLGRHRIYRHPAQCSPNMARAMMRTRWMYAPPGEGDL